MFVDNQIIKLKLKKFIIIKHFFYKIKVNNYVNKFLILLTY